MNKIYLEREMQGFSQKDLAIKAGISQSSLHYIEKNENSPSIDTLKKIAKALGKKVSDLID